MKFDFKLNSIWVASIIYVIKPWLRKPSIMQQRQFKVRFNIRNYRARENDSALLKCLENCLRYYKYLIQIDLYESKSKFQH